MIKGVLFDLGNTLAEYFPKWTPVLRQSIADAHAYLIERGQCGLTLEEVWPRVDAENHEARNYRVRPLEQRLRYIFALSVSDEDLDGVCRVFMKPTFALGKCYDDAKPVLAGVRAMGLKTAIVSNAPWGSPAGLWHEEIHRLGLHDLVDLVVMCTDTGWRKPARPIFHYVLDKLQLSPHDCVFVGDDPRWDMVGPRRVGMDAIVIDRPGTAELSGVVVIRSLHGLAGVLVSRNRQDP